MIFREKHYGTIMVLHDMFKKLLQYENWYGIYLMVSTEKHYDTILVLDDIFRKLLQYEN